MSYFFFTSPCAGGLGSTDARSGNTFAKYHLKFLQPSLLLSLSRSLMSPMSTFFSSSDFLLHKRNFSVLEMWSRTQQRVSHQFLKERKSRIYLFGEKSRVVEGDELPRGSGGMPPRNLLEWICAEMQSGAFWDTILRNVTLCALTSIVASGWFFRYSYLYTVMITIYLAGGGGEAGHFREVASTPQIP